MKNIETRKNRALMNDAGLRKGRTVLLSVLAILTGAAAFGSISGCGGGSSSQKLTAGDSRSEKGRMELNIHWPKRSQTRLIPQVTDLIRVVLTRTDTGQVLGTREIRGGGDTPPPPSTVTFTDLDPGQVTLKATGFNFYLADGTQSEIALAEGSVTDTIVSGQTTRVRVTMQSLIDRLEVKASSLEDGVAQPNSQFSVSVTARNAAGDFIPVEETNLIWSISDTSVFLFNDSIATPGVGSQTGVTVVGGRDQSAVISVRETESGKTGEITVSTAESNEK